MPSKYSIMKLTWRLSKGQRHEKMERGDHRKQSEKWDDNYKHVYPCEGQWEGEERHLGMESSHFRRMTTNFYPEQRK